MDPTGGVLDGDGRFSIERGHDPKRFTPAAAEVYCVVITPDGRSVDAEATARPRAR